VTGRPAGRDGTTAAPGRARPGDPAFGGPGADAGPGPADTPREAAAGARRGLLARVRRGLLARVSRRPRWLPSKRPPSPSRGPSPYRTAFYLLAAAGVLAAGAWLLLGSRFLAVRSVQVTGTHLVPKSEVLAAAAIPQGQPLIRVDAGAVAGRIERIPQVQSAQVSRQWPDGVLITVQERTPALAVPLVGGGFALVDASGVVVQQVKAQPPGIPRFIPAGPLPGNPGLRAAATVLRQLPPAIARRVVLVTVPTLDAVTLRLSGRITVDWGSSGQPAQKARVLAILLRTGARYVDVSAPGTAAAG
jgi:cell division protein FtsQ